MRIEPERLQKITGLVRPKAQAKWFKLNLGADVPCDSTGPILSDAAYEKLLERRLGLGAQSANEVRPTVKLRKKA